MNSYALRQRLAEVIERAVKEDPFRPYEAAATAVLDLIPETDFEGWNDEE